MITFWWKIIKKNMFSLTITCGDESCTVSLETFVAIIMISHWFCICREPHTLIQKASAAVTAVNPAVLKEAIWDRRVFSVFFLLLSTLCLNALWSEVNSLELHMRAGRRAVGVSARQMCVERMCTVQWRSVHPAYKCVLPPHGHAKLSTGHRAPVQYRRWLLPDLPLRYRLTLFHTQTNTVQNELKG